MNKRHLLEAASLVSESASDDGTWKVRVISEGKGSSGIYTAELLEKHHGAFDNVLSFKNHPTGWDGPQERDFTMIAGMIVGATWIEKDERGLTAVFANYLPDPEYKDKLERYKDKLGLSIYIEGSGFEDENGDYIVDWLNPEDPYGSLDVVIAPGARGKFMENMRKTYESAVEAGSGKHPGARQVENKENAYGQVLRYGQIVNESLAKVVYKVVQKTKKGAQNAGVKLTTPSNPGGAAVVGEGQDIQLVNSSQRSFDFTAARPLAAMAASAWNVTNPDLLNDSSASGSSYGSLNALVLGNLNAMLGMQVEWTQFFQDVFVAFGHGRIVVEWAPIESPDPYREGQIVGLAWNMGLVHPDEARPRIMEIAQIKDLHKGKAPEGVLLPNNKDSWERADIDPKDGPATGTATSTASPDQGVSNGTGGAGSTINNDTRTDNIESLLRDMAQSEFLTEFRNLVERFEAAKQ